MWASTSASSSGSATGLRSAEKLLEAIQSTKCRWPKSWHGDCAASSRPGAAQSPCTSGQSTKTPRNPEVCEEFQKSYPARIRTWTKRAKISCATVTLPGIGVPYSSYLPSRKPLASWPGQAPAGRPLLPLWFGEVTSLFSEPATTGLLVRIL